MDELERENTELLAPDGALSDVERERVSLVTQGDESRGLGSLSNEKIKG